MTRDLVEYVLQFVSYPEVEFLVTRSSGAGGQHVNRTNSAVQLRFSISNSRFSIEDQFKFLKKLKSHIVQEDVIQIRSETERDQKMNKDSAFKKLIQLLANALHEPKKRRPTKPTRSSVKKRLESKTKRSQIKKNRSEKVEY